MFIASRYRFDFEKERMRRGSLLLNPFLGAFGAINIALLVLRSAAVVLSSIARVSYSFTTDPLGERCG